MCIFSNLNQLNSPLTPEGGTPTKYAQFVPSMNIFSSIRERLPLRGLGG